MTMPIIEAAHAAFAAKLDVLAMGRTPKATPGWSNSIG